MQPGKDSMDIPSQRSVLSLHRLRSLYTHLTFPSLLRLILTFVLLTGSVLASWSLLVPPAAAASLKTTASAASLQVARQDQPQHNMSSTTAQQLTSSSSFLSRSATQLAAVHTVSSTAPYDGLGQLPFYTFIKHPLTSSSCTCGGKTLYVNVADGNLLLHSVEEQVRGTGIDLSVESFYNSLANSSRDLGNNWNFSVGNDVRLDFSDPLGGIIYHGPSGYSAYFAKNSNGTFKDVPGLNATLVKNGDGSYDMTFHQSSEKLHFGGSGHLLYLQDKNGNKISIAYDGSYDVVAYTDTQSRTTSVNSQAVAGFTDPGGEVVKIADPNGKVVTYSYDSSHRLTNTTDQKGHSTQYGYNNNDLTSVTDGRDNITTIAYDGSHRVTSIKDPLNGVTSFTYNSGTTVVTDANGHATTYTYDAQYKVTSVKDANGNVSKTSFDATNYNVTQTTDALTNTNIFQFDVNNNLTSVTDGNGKKSTATYASPGLTYYPDSATDEQGNKLSYSYNGNANLTQVKDGLASQNTENYSYNTNGTINSVTDANGHITSYSYDSKGNLTGITQPSPLGAETLTHDVLSRVTSVTDGKNQKTTYGYTNLNQIETITYADGSTINYSYDQDNNLISQIDHTGTTSFTYDALNRMTSKTLPGGATISYSYDKVGNLTHLH